MGFDIVRGRVEKLRALMKGEGMDALILLVTEGQNSESCHYISGFRGSAAGLVIDGKREFLITDGRYQTQAPLQSPFDVTIQSALPLPEYIAKFVGEKGYSCVGFESAKLFHNVVEGTLKKVSTNWKDASSLIPSLRRSKDASEVDAIRKAGVVARKAYDIVLSQVQAGMTESEFSSRILYEIKKAGGEKGWTHGDFIVASGQRGAMCHGRATDKPFETGDTVTLDFGATVGGYMSDITRNFAVGKAQPRALELCEIVIKAHHAAAAALRPGATGKEVDAAARKVIADAGYEKNFIHGLGHGLGLEIHEAPRLSPISTDTLKAGDVVTVEPGIYIDGWGGLRVEDDYLITADGAECITQSDDQQVRVVG